MTDIKTVVEFDPVTLSVSVERLERRVAALEAALAAATTRPDDRAPERPEPAEPVIAIVPDVEADGGWTVLGTVTAAGRTLVVLGGAYLLRALTEGAVVPASVGVAAGLAYALIWIALCARQAGPSRVSSAFHGLTAALIGFPLIWEATVRFAILTAEAGALTLSAFSLLVLLAARRAGIEGVAWVGTLGGIAAAFALAYSTSALIPYTLVAAAIGIATLWLGYLDEWTLLRWPAAAAVNLMVLFVTLRAVDARVPVSLDATLTVQLLVLAAYLASFVVRTLLRGREVILFEFVQAAAAMGVCFGGALWVLTSAGVSAVPLGASALVLAAAAYTFAFSWLEPRGQPRNVTFFTSLGLALALAGIVLVLSRGAGIALMAALALGYAEWGRRSCRVLLATHGTVFAMVLAGLAGLVSLAWHGLAAGTSAAWPLLSTSAMAALAVVAANAAWPVPGSRADADNPPARALRFTRLALLLFAGAGTAIAAIVPLVTAAPGAGADAGVVATTRTVVLVLLAVALVTLPQRYPPTVRIWLSYGILGTIALKLLVEDLPRGRPATQFIALALYGAALIAIPRLGRRHGAVTVLRSP